MEVPRPSSTPQPPPRRSPHVAPAALTCPQPVGARLEARRSLPVEDRTPVPTALEGALHVPPMTVIQVYQISGNLVTTLDAIALQQLVATGKDSVKALKEQLAKEFFFGAA